MVKVDLITGFLGSGKTTFIRKYVKHLLSKGQKIAILENDFGAVNVDMMLLKDLEGDNCSLEMIAGGCDYDCHVRRTKTKLIALGMVGFDRVIVEPSGIYDVDEFFDVLRDEPLCDWYEIGSVITILDAGLEDNLSEESEYLLTSQLTNAGKIVISKINSDKASGPDALVDRINTILSKFKSERTFTTDDVIAKDWEEFTDREFDEIINAGYVTGDHTKLWFDERRTFKSLYFMNVVMPVEELRNKITRLFNDEKAGHIFRIKGFMPENNRWYEINATREQTSVSELIDGQEVIIVIGEDLNEEEIDSILKSCSH
ncbi:MAG: GTP-binding protein [Lachnospiraceae bacterium]|nr:GTP-binding protein [Lachnospiraceae bacterium]MBP5299585.1 GTP-binding protein [Lachnospiraceae bacterium]